MYPHEMTELRSVLTGFDDLAISLVRRGRIEISHKGVADFKQFILLKNLYSFNFN